MGLSLASTRQLSSRYTSKNKPLSQTACGVKVATESTSLQHSITAGEGNVLIKSLNAHQGKGRWFYLYSVMDLWSCMVSGWTVAGSETAVIAEQLLETSIHRQQIQPHRLIAHSGRGSQMTASNVADLYDSQGPSIVIKTKSVEQ